MREGDRTTEMRTVDGDPFHDIHVLGEHHDCLEIACHKRCFDERAAEIEGLRGRRSSR